LGDFIYDQLLRRRPHFLHELSRAVDFAFVKAALKDSYVDTNGFKARRAEGLIVFCSGLD
jgi:hypothetical protein